MAAAPVLVWSGAGCDATDPTEYEDVEDGPPGGEATDNPEGDPEPRPPADPTDPPYY